MVDGDDLNPSVYQRTIPFMMMITLLLMILPAPYHSILSIITIINTITRYDHHDDTIGDDDVDCDN